MSCAFVPIVISVLSWLLRVFTIPNYFSTRIFLNMLTLLLKGLKPHCCHSVSQSSDKWQCWLCSIKTFQSIPFCLTASGITTKNLRASLKILFSSITFCIVQRSWTDFSVVFRSSSCSWLNINVWLRLQLLFWCEMQPPRDVHFTTNALLVYLASHCCDRDEQRFGYD